MAEQQQLVRLNVPGKLGPKETHDSLSFWEVQVKTYYARDHLFSQYYGGGDKSNWRRALPNYGFAEQFQTPIPSSQREKTVREGLRSAARMKRSNVSGKVTSLKRRSK